MCAALHLMVSELQPVLAVYVSAWVLLSDIDVSEHLRWGDLEIGSKWVNERAFGGPITSTALERLDCIEEASRAHAWTFNPGHFVVHKCSNGLIFDNLLTV